MSPDVLLVRSRHHWRRGARTVQLPQCLRDSRSSFIRNHFPRRHLGARIVWRREGSSPDHRPAHDRGRLVPEAPTSLPRKLYQRFTAPLSDPLVARSHVAPAPPLHLLIDPLSDLVSLDLLVQRAISPVSRRQAQKVLPKGPCHLLSLLVDGRVLQVPPLHPKKDVRSLGAEEKAHLPAPIQAAGRPASRSRAQQHPTATPTWPTWRT